MEQWWKRSVIYQIYPRSFADSNGDGIGDLNGITAHLDYLKELGIDVIWLSPVYQSPNADNGYDISDYRQIMQDFGTMEDFDRMLAEAHRRGIKIIMDLVVNHTSDQHRWFVESRSGVDSPYRDYYIWKEGRDGQEPNNWGADFGGSAWSLDEKSGMYYLHCFSPQQPDLNWENEQVRNEVYDMMKWWLDKGIDGFRMDVISMISKDQSFPDGPVENGLYGNHKPYVCNGPRVHEFLREMNEKVLSKYDIMTVGEALGATLEDARLYAGEDTHELNMIFHFEHVSLGEKVNGKWTCKRVPLKELRAVLNKWQTGLEGTGWNSLYWDNHDQPRAVSRFGNDSPLYREVSAKMLAICLHMMKGTPYIYQGEEIGMTNPYFDRLEDYRDVESIHAYEELTESGLVGREEMMQCLKVISRDNARTPMQWNKQRHAGFTEGIPWISVNSNYLSINAEDERKKPDGVFACYQKLIRLRKEIDIVVYGEFRGLMEESDSIYAYERLWKGERLLVVCNFTEEEQACPLLEDAGQAEEIISNYKEHKACVLQPYEARVLLFRRRPE